MAKQSIKSESDSEALYTEAIADIAALRAKALAEEQGILQQIIGIEKAHPGISPREDDEDAAKATYASELKEYLNGFVVDLHVPGLSPEGQLRDLYRARQLRRDVVAELDRKRHALRIAHDAKLLPARRERWLANLRERALLICRMQALDEEMQAILDEDRRSIGGGSNLLCAQHRFDGRLQMGVAAKWKALLADAIMRGVISQKELDYARRSP